MTWTAPAAGAEFAISEVVTASKMNTKITDNLRYLKGIDGAVAIQNTLTATAGAASTDVLVALSGNTANYAGFAVGRAASEARLAVPASAGQFAAGAAAGDAILRVDDVAKKVLIGAGGTETMVVSSTAVGIGTPTPLGKLHVKGAGAIAGAGFAIGSVAAVTSLDTVFAAGTITRAGLFLILDRNNTGGGINTVSTLTAIAALSGSFTYTNNDTITIAVTAGGAVTAQRTTGTNGTHDIVILAIFL